MGCHIGRNTDNKYYLIRSTLLASSEFGVLFLSSSQEACPYVHIFRPNPPSPIEVPTTHSLNKKLLLWSHRRPCPT